MPLPLSLATCLLIFIVVALVVNSWANVRLSLMDENVPVMDAVGSGTIHRENAEEPSEQMVKNSKEIFDKFQVFKNILMPSIFTVSEDPLRREYDELPYHFLRFAHSGPSEASNGPPPPLGRTASQFWHRRWRQRMGCRKGTGHILEE
jgi:hypothetical protein